MPNTTHTIVKTESGANVAVPKQNVPDPARRTEFSAAVLRSRYPIVTAELPERPGHVESTGSPTNYPKAAPHQRVDALLDGPDRFPSTIEAMHGVVVKMRSDVAVIRRDPEKSALGQDVAAIARAKRAVGELEVVIEPIRKRLQNVVDQELGKVPSAAVPQDGEAALIFHNRLAEYRRVLAAMPPADRFGILFGAAIGPTNVEGSEMIRAALEMAPVTTPLIFGDDDVRSYFCEFARAWRDPELCRNAEAAALGLRSLAGAFQVCVNTLGVSPTDIADEVLGVHASAKMLAK